jgi:carboxymethylenebutenolidase
MNRAIEFPAGKKTATGYFAPSVKGAGPGLLVLHAWWGLNTFSKDFCRRLAGAGFTVLAPDLYHGEMAKTSDDAKALRSKLDSALATKELAGAVDYLRGQKAVTGKQIGVIGFSLGAFYGIKLATLRPADVGVVVTFYGARSDDFSKSRAAFLCHFAETDPYVSAEARKKMEARLRAAKREAVFHIYPGTGHWFFESDRKEAYSAEAAALA